MNNKVLNLGINKEEYEKYCKELGLDPKHKMSKIRYASTKDEDAKELLKKIESGEVDLDQVKEIEIDVKECKKDLAKGLKMLFEGINYLANSKEKLEGHPFYDLTEDDRAKIATALMESWGELIINLNDCITKGAIAFGFVNFMKGKKENDKKAE